MIDRTTVRAVEARGTVIMTRVAVAILLLTDVLYLVLIKSQADSSPQNPFAVPFVAGYMVLMAALLSFSLIPRLGGSRMRTALRAGAAGGMMLLGTLAAFSIGLPILVGGALAVVSAGSSLARPIKVQPAALAFLAAAGTAAVLVLGLEVAGRLIVCPAHGEVAGSGSGLLSGPYHYECINGVLSYHSGA